MLDYKTASIFKSLKSERSSEIDEKMRVESNRNQVGKNNESKKEGDINRPKYRYEEIIKKYMNSGRKKETEKSGRMIGRREGKRLFTNKRSSCVI